MKVENRSPTTTATAVAMMRDRKRATFKFLPIKKDVFNYEHSGFRLALLKTTLLQDDGPTFLGAGNRTVS